MHCGNIPSYSSLFRRECLSHHLNQLVGARWRQGGGSKLATLGARDLSLDHHMHDVLQLGLNVCWALPRRRVSICTATLSPPPWAQFRIQQPRRVLSLSTFVSDFPLVISCRTRIGTSFLPTPDYSVLPASPFTAVHLVRYRYVHATSATCHHFLRARL